MPLYEYECTSCHRRMEKIQKYSDADLTVCPRCSGRLERTITAAAMVFKGGGWYKDGYASVKHDRPSDSGDMSASASSSESGSSSDTNSSSHAGSSAAESSASSDSNSGSSGDSATLVTAPAAAATSAVAATAKA